MMNKTSDLTLKLLQNWDGNSRFIIAIAGPPGAGKSTLAEQLKQEFDNILKMEVAQIVPMDGFHKSNDELDCLNLRWCKGTPQTFDADEYVSLIRQIRESKCPVDVPVFDRQDDRVIERALTVHDGHRIIVTEGNYLLLDQEPWNQLGELFDITIYLDPAMETLEKRLIRRWQGHGHSIEDALERAAINDIPNAMLVREHSVKADIVISNQ